MVVNSTPEKGGTWNGVIEDLKSEWVPLWVQSKDDPESGNATLVQKGARWFPRDVPALSTLWEMVSGGHAPPKQAELPLLQSETVNAAAETATTPTKATSAERDGRAADALPSGNPIEKAHADYNSSEPTSDFYSLFLLRLLELTDGDPMNVEDIAARLELEKAQVNAWLKRGTADGQIRKISKPVRYQSASSEDRQASLF